ncbi:MAG TPA: acyltransferase family protein, partial [Lysobacter sp.]
MEPESGRSLAYRADIDGLRGIAVLAVVLYHLDLGPLAGGFAGVDIFFVISGFLITSIIQRRIDEGRFSFAWFYERRIRRLFPALAAMLVGTLVLGAWLLLPSDLALVGKGTAATLLFASNVFFWRTSGYFNTESGINPLLHTWSLAVEEQFYIGLPILLLVLHRYARGRLALALGALAVVSFAACVALTPLRPSAAFYLSPFRAWELLAGSLLAVGAVPAVKSRATREAVALAGLAVVVASLLLLKPGVTIPGWRMAIPVLGTCALIHVGTSGGSAVHTLLRTRGLVAVGLISYSLYLWHWPLLVFARYRNDLEPLGDLRWAVLVASFAIAWASYRFIEQPFRHARAGAATGPLFRRTGVAVALLGVVAVGTVALRGLPQRFDPVTVALDRERHVDVPFIECNGSAGEEQGGRCRIGHDAAEPTVLLWGDSYALSWAPAMDNVLERQNLAARLAVNMGCPPLADTHTPTNAGCRSFNDRVLEHLESRPGYRTVVIHASWHDYAMDSPLHRLEHRSGLVGNTSVFPRALQATIERVRATGVDVWLIGPTPGAPSAAPLRLAMSRLHGTPPPEGREAGYFREHSVQFREAVARLESVPGVSFTDPSTWFCGAQRCNFVANGLPLYRDGGHLNAHGTRFIEPHIESALPPALRTRAGGPAGIFAGAAQ